MFDIPAWKDVGLPMVSTSSSNSENTEGRVIADRHGLWASCVVKSTVTGQTSDR